MASFPRDVEDDKGSVDTQAQAKTAAIREVSAADQALFKARVEGYHEQLTKGCANRLCENPFCAANAAIKKYKIKPTEAALLAMKLAQAGRAEEFLCIDLSAPANATNAPDRVSVDLQDVQHIVNLCKASGDYSPFIRFIGANLASVSSVGVSFVKSPSETKIDGTDSGLDFIAVRAFYRLIYSLPDNVIAAFATTLTRLIADLQATFNALPPEKPNSKAKIVKLAALRPFFFLFENPNWTHPHMHRSVTAAFLPLLLSLPQNRLDLFVQTTVKEFDEARFRAFHKELQEFISLRVLTSTESILNRDNALTSAVKVMGWLWEVNEQKKWLKLTDFYNSVLCDNISLREDYSNWKRSPPRPFAFAHYPFILTPELKAKYMNVESVVSQQRQRDNAIFSALTQGVMELPYLVFRIRRSHLIADSIDNIAAIRVANPGGLKKKLKVMFEGEEGVDEGGVSKEWFQLLVAELFSLKYGMFIEDETTRTHWFNQKSPDFTEFELLGTVLGLAIYNNILLDLHFPLLVYKKLLINKYVPTFADLAEINPSLARGLQQLLDYPGDSTDLDLNFQISYDYFGAQETYDLVPNGAEVQVNNSNREEYVRLYLNYLLDTSVAAQFEAFKRGFSLVVAGQAINLLQPEELQLLICGSPELNFAELERHVIYDNGYDKNHQTIKHFWSVVHSLSQEDKRKLLSFSTGSDRAPIGGLGRLQFVITQSPDSDRLPTAHTCFNHLILPAYPTREKLERLLRTAIANSQGFGML